MSAWLVGVLCRAPKWGARLNRLSLLLVPTTVLVVILSKTSHAAEVEFTGVPSSQCQMADGNGACKRLSQDQGNGYRVLIVQESGRYLWKSRGGRELIRTQSGAFVNYIDPAGGGFVKVQADGSYFEVVHLGLALIAYWGRAD